MGFHFVDLYQCLDFDKLAEVVELFDGRSPTKIYFPIWTYSSSLHWPLYKSSMVLDPLKVETVLE